MVGRGLALAVAVAGCGRVGFDVYIDAPHGHPSPPDATAASLCAASSFVMCDGFESGMTADPPWSTNYSVTVDAVHVYRGLLAAHAHIPAASTCTGDISELIDNTNRGTFGTNTAYLRVFLYLPSTSPSTFGLANVDPLSNAPGQAASVNVSSGELEVQVDSANTTTTGTSLPTDRWACLELAVRGSTTTSSNDAEVVMWLDGVQLADVTAFNLSPSQQFIFGVVPDCSGAQLASDLWMDEVVLDTARIGCVR